MARYQVRVTDNFIEEAACIEQERMAARIEMIAESLCGNPTMGKPCENKALHELYGESLRIYAAAAYEIIYRFDGATVDMLGITLSAPTR